MAGLTDKGIGTGAVTADCSEAEVGSSALIISSDEESVASGFSSCSAIEYFGGTAGAVSGADDIPATEIVLAIFQSSVGTFIPLRNGWRLHEKQVGI